MKVYVDVVIAINFLFDFFLLTSINYILRRNKKLLHIILGSSFGSITILCLFIKMTILQTFIFKIITSIIMLIITFGYHDFSYFKKNFIYFYLVSMLLGGSIYFLKSQFSYSNNGLISNKQALPISYILIVIISLIIYLKYIKSFKELKNNYSNYYNCEIYLDKNNICNCTAFLDTGNKLNDPYSHKSIILINKDRIDKMKIRSPIYVPYNSLNNHGLLECYKVHKIVINGKESNNFLLGISNEKFFMDGIDCIINNRIMEDLK